MTLSELSNAVRDTPAVFTDSCPAPFGFPTTLPILSLDAYQGIVEFSPADQVVVVRAGTRLSALNQELAADGQGIPHHFPVNLGDPALHQLIGAGLPHAWEAPGGTWRDWLLGMTLIQPDGTVVKCGSKAVKNVAGYDVQRLMIGSRGTLAITAEVILRTLPLAAWPAAPPPVPCPPELWIHRTLRTDLKTTDRPDLLSIDEATATVWSSLPPPARFPHDWQIGPATMPELTPTLARLYRTTKASFDPDDKLNPGALGVWP